MENTTTETRKVTLSSIQHFFQSANSLMQNKPDILNHELGDCMKKIAPKLQAKLAPLQEHTFNTKRKLDDLIISMSDKHIIEVLPPNNPQGNQTINHRHEFMPVRHSPGKKFLGLTIKKAITAKDSYKQYIAESEKITKQANMEYIKLMNSEVEITPIFCNKLPPFAILPEKEQAPFIGFVIKEKKAAEVISIHK